VHAAELVAVHYAVHMLRDEHMGQSWGERRQCVTCTIVSDSKSALQALANPSRRLGHQIVYNTIKLVKTPGERGVMVRLVWVYGFKPLLSAYRRGNEATSPNGRHLRNLDSEIPFKRSLR